MKDDAKNTMTEDVGKQPFLTANGDSRGYVDPVELRELWLNTGTRCNLQCPTCFEGSSPKSDRLEQLSFADARVLIDEAVTMGVQRLCFTGGEPFVNRDFLKILT